MFGGGDRFHDNAAGEAGGAQATGAGDRVKARKQIPRHPDMEVRGKVGGAFVGGDHDAVLSSKFHC